jgi:hypothetical protein
VVERRVGAGKAVIPRDGVVFSFGGTEPPAPLDGLSEGDEVELVPEYTSLNGTDGSVWSQAPDVIGGAGLLMFEGRAVEDWAVERLRDGFAAERHPRTVIGVNRQGVIWLVAVDGRDPSRSVGMTFGELQRLAGRLRLTDALNLDGGGSTTMVAAGVVVNRPSDPTGPRKVSDTLLVFDR